MRNATRLPSRMPCFRVPRSPLRVAKSEGAPGFPEAPRLAGHKPDFVPAACATGDDHFSPTARRRPADDASRSPRRQCDYYPEAAPPMRGGPDAGPPVMSCTAGGFSCPAHCCAGGGLLPRLFTLARSLRRRRSVFCDTVCRGGLSPATPADSPRPAVWWCPDFPLAGEPRAIVGQRVQSTVRSAARKGGGVLNAKPIAHTTVAEVEPRMNTNEHE